MPYRIIALEKKNIIETNEWKKGDHYITISTTWRTGSAEIEEQPDLSTYDPEVGIIISEEFESPQYNIDDECGRETSYSPSMTDEEIENIEAILERENEYALEEKGWDIDYRTMYFRGPLKVESV